MSRRKTLFGILFAAIATVTLSVFASTGFNSNNQDAEYSGLWVGQNLFLKTGIVRRMDDCLRGYAEWYTHNPKIELTDDAHFNCQIYEEGLGSVDIISIDYWQSQQFRDQFWSMTTQEDGGAIRSYAYAPLFGQTQTAPTQITWREYPVSIVIFSCDDRAWVEFEVGPRPAFGTIRDICF